MLSKIEKYELILMPIVMILAYFIVSIVGWFIIGEQSLGIISLPLLLGVLTGLIGTFGVHNYLYPITSMDRFTFITRITVVIILVPTVLMALLINTNYLLVLVSSNFIFGGAIAVLGLGSFLTYQSEIQKTLH